MSNIKVKGRVFRNIEKMNLDQLGEVRRSLTDAITEYNKLGLKLASGPRTPAVVARIARMDAEVQQWAKRLKIVEALAKRDIKQTDPDQLANRILAQHGQTPPTLAGA
jgi:hypothetical protein